MLGFITINDIICTQIIETALFTTNIGEGKGRYCKWQWIEMLCRCCTTGRRTKLMRRGSVHYDALIFPRDFSSGLLIRQLPNNLNNGNKFILCSKSFVNMSRLIR